MIDDAQHRQPAHRRAWEWLLVALERGGMALLAILVVVAVLALVLAVLTWVTGLGPEVPGREHY